MSFYATMVGEIEYQSENSFNEMVESLIAHEWVDREGRFLDECGDPISDEPMVLRADRTIHIPYALHRNLSRVRFFDTSPLPKGYIVGASNDGCFEGWLDTCDGETLKSVNFDLNTWGAEHGFEDEPKMEEFDNEDEYHENMSIHQVDIINEFIETHQR